MPITEKSFRLLDFNIYDEVIYESYEEGYEEEEASLSLVS